MTVPPTSSSRTYFVNDIKPLIELCGRHREERRAEERVRGTSPWTGARANARASRIGAWRKRRIAQHAAVAIAVDTVADKVAREILHEAFAYRMSWNDRNPYSLWTLRRLGSISARLVALLRRAELADADDNRQLRPRAVSVEQYPQVHHRLRDRAWVAATIAAEILRRLEVARTRGIVAKVAHLPGSPPLTGAAPQVAPVTVQHLATGLRIQMKPGPQGFGGVEARTYRIESIDDTHPERPERWEDWIGLGFGAHLYQRGAAALPNHRWMLNATRAGAAAIRARLHRQDPFVWSATCGWCTARHIDWWQATPATFAGHPKR